MLQGLDESDLKHVSETEQSFSAETFQSEETANVMKHGGKNIPVVLPELFPSGVSGLVILL